MPFKGGLSVGEERGGEKLSGRIVKKDCEI